MYFLYGVKFNGEIDLVQFIFIQCVVYFFRTKIVFTLKVNERNECPYEKDCLLVRNLPNKSKLHFVLQKYIDVAVIHVGIP
jgi:hypothetical protein